MGINPDRPDFRRDARRDLDGFAQGSAQEDELFLYQALECHDPRLEGLMTGISQELLSQRGTALGGGKGGRNEAGDRLLQFDLLRGELEGPLNDRQKVVEIMRDAAGQL